MTAAPPPPRLVEYYPPSDPAISRFWEARTSVPTERLDTARLAAVGLFDDCVDEGCLTGSFEEFLSSPVPRGAQQSESTQDGVTQAFPFDNEQKVGELQMTPREEPTPPRQEPANHLRLPLVRAGDTSPGSLGSVVDPALAALCLRREQRGEIELQAIQGRRHVAWPDSGDPGGPSSMSGSSGSEDQGVASRTVTAKVSNEEARPGSFITRRRLLPAASPADARQRPAEVVVREGASMPSVAALRQVIENAFGKSTSSKATSTGGNSPGRAVRWAVPVGESGRGKAKSPRVMIPIPSIRAAPEDAETTKAGDATNCTRGSATTRRRGFRPQFTNELHFDDSDEEGGALTDATTKAGDLSGSPMSSMTPQRAKRQMTQPRFHLPRGREGRNSCGLVFHPGSQTVDCVRAEEGTRRYSLGFSEEGKQKLLPIPKADTSKGSGEASDADISPCTAIARAQPQLDRSLSALTDGEIFTKFLTADSATFALRSFVTLLSRCEESRADASGAEHEFPFQKVRRCCGGRLPWRARQIWQLLDARFQKPDYEDLPLRKTQAVVCGAGPVGQRAALELLLLGAQVTVVEKRPESEAFGRINRVHLWEWAKQDTIGWGAKVFDPPGGAFGGDGDFCHIGIGELQLLLMKNVLLLGGHFIFNQEATRLDDSSLICKRGLKLPCTSLVLADGASSPLSRAFGFKSVTIGLRGKGSAIGVVANFVNSRETQEMALRQFAWARQFNQPLFAQLEKATSVNLENVVYYKSQAHHYLVMTPSKRTLLAAGVLRQECSAGRLLHGSNVDVQELSQMVRNIGSFFSLPAELAATQGAMIFDFSGVKRLESPAMMVGDVFVCTVGDALLEPFWPEGLGIIRGFLSALDAAASITLAAAGKQDAALAQMSSTFNILKSVTAQSAGSCLQKDLRQYGLQPKTRYIFSHK